MNVLQGATAYEVFPEAGAAAASSYVHKFPSLDRLCDSCSPNQLSFSHREENRQRIIAARDAQRRPRDGWRGAKSFEVVEPHRTLLLVVLADEPDHSGPQPHARIVQILTENSPEPKRRCQ